MIKRVPLILLVIFNILGVIYLALPIPPIPDLPNSVKSDEPGDTVQLANVSAYYTNATRNEVISFYKNVYQAPLRIDLNHPPEKSKEVFRDTMQSYYLEEFILPFKQSLYVNGFEWENDVFTKPEKRAANRLLFQGKEYKAKITIRTFPTSFFSRAISFVVTETAIIFLVFVMIKYLPKSKND